MADFEALHARRAARRAQRRRRRQIRVALAVVLVACAGGAVAVALGAGGPSGVRASARAPQTAVTLGPAPAIAPAPAPRRKAVSPLRESAGIANIRRLARLGLPIYCAGPRGRDVAFTFDDGPGPYTYLALRKLTQAHERATFFVVARSMNFFPGWLPREMRIAALGDHTYTHPYLPGLSRQGIVSEIARTKQKIEHDSGQPVYLFRPPYGARNAVVDDVAKQLGLLEIIWNVDSADSLGANWAGIIRNVEAGLHPGAIILMHENRGQTIRALSTLLPYLQAHHLRSVSLPELFASDPPSEAQVRAGARGCGVAGGSRTGT